MLKMVVYLIIYINYNPKICDFGFGRLSEDGKVSDLLGTPHSMAPEILINSL